MVNVLRKWWVWPIIIVLVIAIVFTLLPASSTTVYEPLAEFVEHAKAGRVRSVEVNGSEIEFTVPTLPAGPQIMVLKPSL